MKLVHNVFYHFISTGIAEREAVLNIRSSVDDEYC